MEPMSKVLFPADLGVVSAEDVYGAVIEQFCGLPNDVAKQVLPVLARNLKFSVIFDQVCWRLRVRGRPRCRPRGRPRRLRDDLPPP